MPVRIVDNSKRLLRVSEDVFDNALSRMAKDISLVAKSRVPFRRGNLLKEIRQDRKAPLKHRVVVDSEYAAYQERGQRMDGSHRVRKYSTPSTGKNYLKDAGHKITADALQYFKQANNLIRL